MSKLTVNNGHIFLTLPVFSLHAMVAATTGPYTGLVQAGIPSVPPPTAAPGSPAGTPAGFLDAARCMLRWAIGRIAPSARRDPGRSTIRSYRVGCAAWSYAGQRACGTVPAPRDPGASPSTSLPRREGPPARSRDRISPSIVHRPLLF